MITDLTARLMEGDYGRELTEQEILDDELEEGFDFDAGDYLRGQVASASHSNTIQALGDIFNLPGLAGELCRLLLDEAWHLGCEFIPNYMPPFPRKDTVPRFVIYHPPTKSFLRYSLGPKQGFDWDGYGDDMQRTALAIVALSQAPCPWRKPYTSFSSPMAGNSANPTTCFREVVTDSQETEANSK